MNDLAYLTERAKEYVAACTGEFSSTALAKDIGVVDAETRDSIMSDLCALKLVEPTGRRNGQYIPISTDAPAISWQDAKEEYYPLRLPLGLDKMAGVNPKGMVVIAGETNGGKSYFSMLLAHMHIEKNGGQHKRVFFWNSETTPSAIKNNATRIDSDMSHWSGLVVRERASMFHQVIEPNGLNIIDYLQVEDEFYLIGAKLKAIFDAIETGVCIVFLQKNKGAALGIGGNYTLHKPVLALSLNEMHGTNACRIDKLKAPLRYPNPEGMELDFRFNEFGRINTIVPWRYLTKKNREELWKQYERERALSKVSHNYGDF